MRLADVIDMAKCAGKLPLVDAAFARPNGPAGHYMAESVCPGCPIWQPCLDFAMKHGERGPWGGTTERQRRAIHHLNYTHNNKFRGVVRRTWRDGPVVKDDQ